MKRAVGGKNQGYTILETMIFLAVSAAMFVSAMAFISGKQNRTEFASAVRNFESTMNDIANDVSSGYYVYSAKNAVDPGNSITCSANSASFTFHTGSQDKQGSNKGCLFIGTALQFMPAGTNGKERYVSYTLVGRQYKQANFALGDVESYQESGVQPIAPDGTNLTDGTSTTQLGGGATVECVLYATSAVTLASDKPCVAPPSGVVQTDTIAFITKFHTSQLQDQQESGSTSVDIVVPAAASTGSRSTVAVAGVLKGFGTGNPVDNPAGGVYICVQSNGSKQYALVSIGGSNSSFTTKTSISAGSCR